MSRFLVCPQHHVWPLPEEESLPSNSLCPVCGLAGTPADASLTGTVSAIETLSPALVPPLVPDLTVASPQRRVAAAGDDNSIPSVPGYDIIRELGRGGMGVVYLARHCELKRLAALKMILAGAHADRETRSRFRREAEAIARLRHPGIVQIHDIGEHLGRPFIALEYIEGQNLAAQMALGRTNPRTAAQLIETLARIVQHAHERGIIHRDITPRNVLLAPTTSPHGIAFDPAAEQRFEPKITDFGLAKELDGDARQTQTGTIVGTPSYMAPEQAMASPNIGPAADVHALGAILYELLSGRPPFLAETGHETLRQLVERDPISPSGLRYGIPRDLETICLKCLAKEPHKRYATAEDLADDLHHFLNNEPISARPVSRRERAGKWVRRHPAATTMLAVVAASLLVLVAGIVVYNAQIRRARDRAERNFDLAMRAVDEMLSEVGEVRLATEPRMEETRRALLTKALSLQKEFLAQKNDDSRVQFQTAESYRRCADVLRLLGQYDEALPMYEQAIAMLRRLYDDSPDEPQLRKQLAHSLNFAGEVHRAVGRHREAETAYREAIQIESDLAREHPDVPAYRQDQARTLYNLGIDLRESKRPVEAERELRRSTDLLTSLVKSFPGNPDYQQHLARAWLNLGTVTASQDRPGEAQSAYDQAIAILRPLTKKYPDQPDYRHELGVALNNAGNVMSAAEKLDDARALHFESRALFDALAADFPKVPVYRQELANCWNSLGNVDYWQSDFEAALSDWQAAAKLLEGLLAEQKDMAAYRGDLGTAFGNLGLAYHKLSRLPEARENLERAIEHLEKIDAAVKKHSIYEDSLRDSFQNLAEISILQRDHAAAAKAARSLSGSAGATARDRYYAACFLSRCAGLAEHDPELDPHNRDSLVSAYADQSVAALRQALASGFDDTPRIMADRKTLLQAVAARDDFQALVVALEKSSNAQP